MRKIDYFIIKFFPLGVLGDFIIDRIVDIEKRIGDSGLKGVSSILEEINKHLKEKGQAGILDDKGLFISNAVIDNGKGPLTCVWDKPAVLNQQTNLYGSEFVFWVKPIYQEILQKNQNDPLKTNSLINSWNELVEFLEPNPIHAKPSAINTVSQFRLVELSKVETTLSRNNGMLQMKFAPAVGVGSGIALVALVSTVSGLSAVPIVATAGAAICFSEAIRLGRKQWSLSQDKVNACSNVRKRSVIRLSMTAAIGAGIVSGFIGYVVNKGIDAATVTRDEVEQFQTQERENSLNQPINPSGTEIRLNPQGEVQSGSLNLAGVVDPNNPGTFGNPNINTAQEYPVPVGTATMTNGQVKTIIFCPDLRALTLGDPNNTYGENVEACEPSVSTPKTPIEQAITHKKLNF